MRITPTSFLALSSIACSIAAFGQASPTAGALKGVVLAKSGGAVNGAKVEMRNRETGLTRVATTDRQGNFLASLLPPGDYEVAVSAVGMTSIKQGRVRVVINQVTPLNFKLESDNASAVVEVVAKSSAIDVTQTSTQSAIAQEYVEAIPVNGRNFTDLVQMTPGAASNAEGYRTTVEGARGVQNNLQIDGTSFNSKFNGEQRGGTRIPFSFGQDSIKELQVISNSFDAQYGDSAGAVINAVTKTGTNEVHGSLFSLFRPNSFVAKVKPVSYDPKNTINNDVVRTRDFNQFQAGFTLGGPIIKDKLFYFVSVETVSYREKNVPAFGGYVDSATGDFTKEYYDFWNPTTGLGGRLAMTSDGRTLLDEKTTPWDDEIKNTVAMFRVDWAINGNHRLALRLNSQDYKGENDTWSRSRRSDTAWSQNSLLKYKTMSWVAELNSVLSDSLVNDARIQIASERRPVVPNTMSTSGFRIGPSTGSWFYSGTYSNHPSDLTEITTQLQDNLTWFKDDWTVKAGIDLQFIDYKNLYLPSANGAWTFDSYTIAQNWFANPNNLKSSDYITYSQSYSKTNGWSNFKEKFLAGYVQTQYTGLMDRRLMLSLGARFTSENWENNPQPNAKLQGLDRMPSSTSLDPRFGFSLDLFGNAKSVIRGGYGHSSVNNAAQTVSGALMNNGLNMSSVYIQNNSTNLNLFKTGIMSWQARKDASNHLLPVAQGGLSEQASTVSIIHPDAKMAQSRSMSLGFEQELAQGWKVAIRGTYKKFYNLQYFLDVNLWQMTADNKWDATGNGWYQDGYPTKANFFSSSAFGAPTGTLKRPGKAIVAGRLLDLTGYDRVMLSRYDGEGRYKSLVLEASRQTDSGWNLNANVTFAKSEDNNSNERATYNSDSGAVPNPGDPLAWSLSDNDRKFRGNLSFISPSWAGFRFSGFYTFSTGRPFTAVYNSDVNYDGRKIDPVFARNTFRQPSTRNFDIRGTYNLPLPLKQLKAELAVDVYNVFNWANQYTKQTRYADKIGSTPYETFGAIDMPDNRTREVQFTAKFKF